MRSVPSQMTSLARNHWSFMAVGAILTARFFNVRFHSFGSILGESLSRQAGNAPKLEVLDVLGFEDAGYARGLTEVGTASIILQSDPGRAADSLKSLSGPRDKKIFRKTAISRILNDKLGGGLQLQANNFSRSPKIKYGDDYASSLAALYCLAQGRGNEIEELFEGIPDNAKEPAGRLNMEFMEKLIGMPMRHFRRILSLGFGKACTVWHGALQ